MLASGSIVIAAIVPEPPALWLAAALTLAGTATALFRRRAPLVAFAAANALFLASVVTDTFAESLLPLFLGYAVGVYRPARVAWVAFAGGAAAASLAAALGAARAQVAAEPATGWSGEFTADWTTFTISSIVPLLVATLIGTNVGARKRYVAALVDRAAQLARERDAQAEIAGARERERIAREMHDIIAHSLSVMVALAEGAHAAAPERPEQARDAIGRVAETGRRTLGEVRRLLGGVRADGSAPTAPQPGVADLPALVAEFARAGLPVRLTTTGPASADAAVGLSVYRVVQESLTNALRHARGAREVAAAVEWGDDTVEIRVEDDAPASAATTGSGRGILGMRERAALYGGDVEAGPRPTGGWRVRVRMRFERGAG